MLNDIFARRFKELEAKFAALRFVPNSSGMSGTNVPTGEWKQWATSAQSLIRTVYGEGDPHCQNFDAAYKSCNGYDYDVTCARQNSKSNWKKKRPPSST